MTAPTLPRPRPMSDKARTTLAGRIARLALAEDWLLNAPEVRVNGEIVDTSEVKRRVANMARQRLEMVQQLKHRPWENSGSEQADARQQEGK